MRRALGGGPEALALALAAVWLVGTVALPLAHAVQHADDGRASGHCHGTVCHDVAAGGHDPAVRDGSLPDLGSLTLSHGAVVALTPPLTALVPPTLSLAEAAAAPALSDRRADRAPEHVAARGPPIA